jgi:hypothetical protein
MTLKRKIQLSWAIPYTKAASPNYLLTAARLAPSSQMHGWRGRTDEDPFSKACWVLSFGLTQTFPAHELLRPGGGFHFRRLSIAKRSPQPDKGLRILSAISSNSHCLARGRQYLHITLNKYLPNRPVRATSMRLRQHHDTTFCEASSTSALGSRQEMQQAIKSCLYRSVEILFTRKFWH